MTKSKLDIRPIQSKDADRLRTLFDVAFGVQKPKEFFTWKYFHNPAGQVYAYGAPLDERLVASHGNIPHCIKIGNRHFAGAESVDAMVAPEARRQGMWARIARATYADMDRDGIALNYGLAGELTRKAFVEKLGWDYPGEVPRYVKPLDLDQLIPETGARGLAKRLRWRGAMGQQRAAAVDTSAYDVRTVDEFDARYDVFWDAVSAELPIAVVRDATYLNWRYIDSPLAESYTCFAAEKAGKLCGLAVVSLRDAPTAYLLELFVHSDEQAAGVALLDAVTRHANAAKASQIQAFMLPRYTRYVELLQSAGFMHQTGRLVPGELGYTAPLIARPHPDLDLPVDASQLSNWFISMGDHDFY